jgi:hypothetical protein
MNILQAYIKIFGQLFIHIIGLPGSNSHKFAKELAKDLNITYFDIRDYMHKDYPKVVLPNSVSIENKYDVSIIDIKTLSNDIDSAIHKGVLISSYGLFSNKFKIKPNLSILLDISKKYAIQNIIDDNPKINIKQETFLFNHYLLPYIDDIKNNEKINKFFNLKGNFQKEMNSLWEYCIWFIDSKVYSDEAKTLLGHAIQIRVPNKEAKKNVQDYDITRKKLAPPTKYPYTKPQRSYKPKRKPLPNNNVTINKTISNKSSKVTLKNKNNDLSVSINTDSIKKNESQDKSYTQNKNSIPEDPKYDISLDTSNIPDDYDEKENNYKYVTNDTFSDPKSSSLDQSESNLSNSLSSLFIPNEPKKQKEELTITVSHPNLNKFKKSKTKSKPKSKPKSKVIHNNSNISNKDELTITVTHPKQHKNNNSYEESDLLKAVRQNEENNKVEKNKKDNKLLKDKEENQKKEEINRKKQVMEKKEKIRRKKEAERKKKEEIKNLQLEEKKKKEKERILKEKEAEEKKEEIRRKKKTERKKKEEIKKILQLEEKQKKEEERILKEKEAEEKKEEIRRKKEAERKKKEEERILKEKEAEEKKEEIRRKKEAERKKKEEIKKILQLEEKKRKEEEDMLKKEESKIEKEKIKSASEVLSGWQMGGKLSEYEENSYSSSSSIVLINIE